MRVINYKGRAMFDSECVDLNILTGTLINDRLATKVHAFFNSEEETYYLNTFEVISLLAYGRYRKMLTYFSNNYELRLIENNKQCIIVDIMCDGNIIETLQENKVKWNTAINAIESM